ncbi:MAG: prepilin-type N-terminal cleavage/methylation domain-containing protein [Phycisphaerae bacterium]
MRNAFTIVELAVCIAIVAIIAGLAIPSIMIRRENMSGGVMNQTFTVNGLKVTVLENIGPQYKVLILTTPPTQAQMETDFIKAEFAKYKAANLKPEAESDGQRPGAKQ